MYTKHLVEHIQKWQVLARSILNSSVIKDFFTYSFGAILLRAISLFLAPLMLRTIVPEEYGILALVNSCIAIGAPLIGLGLRQVLTLEYFHCTAIERKRLVNDIIVVYLTVCIPLCALLYIIRIPAQQIVWEKSFPDYLLLLALIQMYIYFFVELTYQLLGYERKVHVLIGLQIIVALITISCSFVAVFMLHYGIMGILCGQCIGSLVAAFFGIYCYYAHKYHAHVSYTSSIKKTTYYVRYGAVFLPGLVFAWLLASGNRWFLAKYGTLHEVGIYAIADTFAQLFQVFILLPWSASYLPHILTDYAHNKHALHAVEQRNQTIMWIAMIGVTCMIMCAYFICTPLLRWFLPVNYHAAIEYIWPLLLGYVFLLGSYFASSFVQFHKKNYFLAWIFCVPALLNSALNVILIPHFGIYGCTSATLVSYVTYFSIMLLYNYRLQRTI